STAISYTYITYSDLSPTAVQIYKLLCPSFFAKTKTSRFSAATAFKTCPSPTATRATSSNCNTRISPTFKCHCCTCALMGNGKATMSHNKTVTTHNVRLFASNEKKDHTLMLYLQFLFRCAKTNYS